MSLSLVSDASVPFFSLQFGQCHQDDPKKVANSTISSWNVKQEKKGNKKFLATWLSRYEQEQEEEEEDKDGEEAKEASVNKTLYEALKVAKQPTDPNLLHDLVAQTSLVL
ncbi:MAG: hypothetical protein M1828_000510 [Chrysothrix sp. TS-e1954]|nr:MAG: hypothetical protein M1828_000510 [Chrysothrix sp. TS-e1954]